MEGKESSEFFTETSHAIQHLQSIHGDYLAVTIGEKLRKLNREVV